MDTFKYVVVAFVVVALIADIPPLNVCSPVQVLVLPRFKEATTFPVVGVIVRVPSELDTDPTLAQTPEESSKHPPVNLIPFANVEDAFADEMIAPDPEIFNPPPARVIPDEKVEVADAPLTLRYPARSRLPPSLVEVPVLDTYIYEVVASVVVAKYEVRFPRVEDAIERIPTLVEVGVR